MRSQIAHTNMLAERVQEEVLIQNMGDLTSTEAAAASLGVDPDTWQPIGFMNTAHYEHLVQKNMLSDTLARRLDAYRTVASDGS